MRVGLCPSTPKSAACSERHKLRFSQVYGGSGSVGTEPLCSVSSPSSLLSRFFFQKCLLLFLVWLLIILFIFALHLTSLPPSSVSPTPLFSISLHRYSRWSLAAASPLSPVASAGRRRPVALTAPRRVPFMKFSTCQSQSAPWGVRNATALYFLFFFFFNHKWICIFFFLLLFY